MEFSKEQKNELLDHARQVLNLMIKSGKKLEEDSTDTNYLESAGVFISLHKGNELRGCTGYIEPVSSIWDAITENTITAAINDIRFSEVAVEELEDITIEISILTPSRECTIEEIEIGQNGVILQQGSHKATYLPQVWKDLNNKEQFFAKLCQKAGLDSSCWTDSKTKFYRYDAIVFSERS
jgi:AmmeMemoRadiSam system protein A